MDKIMYSQELWLFMEECYAKHGASSNGAQLNIRGDKLQKRVEQYGEDKVRWMLEHDFDKYHFGN